MQRMQDALLYSSSNQMQRRDAATALADILPLMQWADQVGQVHSGVHQANNLRVRRGQT